MKFCLFVCGGGFGEIAQSAEFMFFAQTVEDALDKHKIFKLTPEDIALLNPNTRTCPVFRTKAAAEITKFIYRCVPVLLRESQDNRPKENPWGIIFNRMFDMSNDSHLFRTREQLEADGWQLKENIFLLDNEKYLPLYEAKMMNLFDHRFANAGESQVGSRIRGLSEYFTVIEHENPHLFAMPRYWVEQAVVARYLNNIGLSPRWFIGFRDVTGNVANIRTVVFAILPFAAVGNSLPLIFSNTHQHQLGNLSTMYSSFVFDFCARQKVGGLHINFYLLNQMPVLPPETYKNSSLWSNGTETLNDWFLPRVLELAYTAWDLETLGHDCGYDGPPFRWDEKRRFLLRCELDAAFFHLYLGSEEEWKKTGSKELLEYFPIPRSAMAYIMETFPIVKRRDIASTEVKNSDGEVIQQGSYITKDTIIEIYDAMSESMRTGIPYQTRLDPPPGPPCDYKGNFIPMSQWDSNNWPPHIHKPREK